MILALVVTVAALLVPVALGVAIVGILWPPLRSQVVLKLCLAIGLGFGVFSCLFFGQIVMSARPEKYWLWTQAIALAVVSVYCYRGSKRRQMAARESASFRVDRSGRTIAVLFALSFAAGMTSFVLISIARPHGERDAWMIWNVGARFLFLGGDRWRDVFSPQLLHADYPLLIPAAVAGSWSNVGSDSVLVPIGIAMLFTFATIGLVASAVTVLRSRTQGMIAGLTLLSTPYLIAHGANQYADVPLAFFVAATVALVMIHDRFSPDRPALILFAGLTAGLAAWTKNEGLLFVLAIALTRLLTIWRRQGIKPSVRELRTLFCGLAPMLLLVAYFKIQLAPASDIASAQVMGRTLPQLLQLTRHAQVWTAIGQKLLVFGRGNLAILAVYGVLVGTRYAERERSGIISGFAMLGTVLTAYALTYVMSPYDLSWHLRTSLDRLLLQLWPSFVLLFFLTVRPPEQLWMPVAPANLDGW